MGWTSLEAMVGSAHDWVAPFVPDFIPTGVRNLFDPGCAAQDLFYDPTYREFYRKFGIGLFADYKSISGMTSANVSGGSALDGTGRTVSYYNPELQKSALANFFVRPLHDSHGVWEIGKSIAGHLLMGAIHPSHLLVWGMNAFFDTGAGALQNHLEGPLHLLDFPIYLEMYMPFFTSKLVQYCPANVISVIAALGRYPLAASVGILGAACFAGYMLYTQYHEGRDKITQLETKIAVAPKGDEPMFSTFAGRYARLQESRATSRTHNWINGMETIAYGGYSVYAGLKAIRGGYSRILERFLGGLTSEEMDTGVGECAKELGFATEAFQTRAQKIVGVFKGLPRAAAVEVHNSFVALYHGRRILANVMLHRYLPSMAGLAGEMVSPNLVSLLRRFHPIVHFLYDIYSDLLFLGFLAGKDAILFTRFILPQKLGLSASISERVGLEAAAAPADDRGIRGNLSSGPVEG